MIAALGSIIVVGVLAETGHLLAGAQELEKMPRIGYLGPRAGPILGDKVFVQALADIGWIEGQNIAIEYRWAAGKWDRLPALAEELVRLKVDILVVQYTRVTQAAMDATTKIPIVMTWAPNAVEHGLVASLARPGGNVTGMSVRWSTLYPKLLELLHEILPNVTRVGFLWDPTSRTFAPVSSALQKLAPAMGITIESLETNWHGDLNDVLETSIEKRVGALVVVGGQYRRFGRQIAEFAAKNKLPLFSISPTAVKEYFGLVSYSPHFPDMMRRAAMYVDKILRGAKPAELPVQLPAKFHLVINMKTAKQLGSTIPTDVLYRATELIK